MNPTEILARTLYAEAGRCPVRGIEALAALVLRRARLAKEDAAARARFAGNSPMVSLPGLVAAVCRAPFQFGCWRPEGAAWRVPEGDAALAICRRIAARAIAGALPDLAAGATHWHRETELPRWAVGKMPLGEAGGITLYRLAA
jgi:N-acetylmuramoyl-L-alanine amidase